MLSFLLAFDCCCLSTVVIFILMIAVAAAIAHILTRIQLPKDTDGSFSSKHGGELVAKVLKDHDVNTIFTLIGGHISPILVAAESIGIKVIDTRHEVTAVFAADAYARLSGKIGVAAVTAGPGLTNTVTAVKNAQMSSSPILIMSGAAASVLKGRGALQDIDHIGLMKSMCKYTVSISRVKEIIPCIRKAIHKAMSGAPGPVFVELPLDVLYPYSIVSKELFKQANSRSLSGKIVNWYSRYYLNNLFDDAFGPRESSPLPVNVKKADKSEIEKCLRMIYESKKPLLLLGSQGTHPAKDCHTVLHAVETLGIPSYFSGMARGMLGKKHNLLFRHKRREALREADLIILGGVNCDFRLSYGRDLGKKAKIIAINLDRDLLFKNSPLFWKCTIGINASVSDFFIRLAAAKESSIEVPHGSWMPWSEHLKQREEEAEAKIMSKSKEDVDMHLNPVTFLLEVEKHIDENTILVADGGDFVGTASLILRPSGPLKWLDPGPFGTLGVGAGFALGAKMSCPDAHVLILYGDGSLGYSIMEFDTFFRHNIKVMAIVGNDACWRQIEREQVPIFQSDVACKLRYSEYEKIAETLGAKGKKITASDLDSLYDVLLSSFQQRNNGSVFLNVFIGKSDIRSGSISV